MAIIAAVEAGGTKFICGLGTEDGKIIDRINIPTTTPEETMSKVIEYFKDKEFDVMGVGSFGPIDPVKGSETYGYITKTPKAYWSDYNIIGELKKHYDVPMEFDTDVNGAALAESWWGAGKGLKNVMYITVGTGIGAGAIQRGEFAGGIGHPEMGHYYVAKHPMDVEKEFNGVCPFHNGCLEGLAAGPSLEARTGVRGENIELNSSVWDIQAYYIAQAAIQATVTFRPDVIVFGGGVMAQQHMLDRVREKFTVLLNGYLPVSDVRDYIVTPAVAGNGSATLGNFVLAKEISERNAK